mgnify:CR=1 FL=1
MMSALAALLCNVTERPSAPLKAAGGYPVGTSIFRMFKNRKYAARAHLALWAPPKGIALCATPLRLPVLTPTPTRGVRPGAADMCSTS